MTPQEVWDVARKIIYIDKIDGFTSKEFSEIFDNMRTHEVMKLPIEEVVQYIHEYEERKKFKVGDIIEYLYDGTKSIVIDKNKNMYWLYSDNGNVDKIKDCFMGEFRKIGTTNLIEQMNHILAINYDGGCN